MSVFDEMMPVRQAVLGMTMQSLASRQFHAAVVPPPGSWNRVDKQVGGGGWAIDKAPFYWEPTNVSILQNHVASGPPFPSAGFRNNSYEPERDGL